jgi:carbon storage regulator CsrA
MLVLSRRLDEKIVLPTIDATVQVLSIRPGVVRLGIEAPEHVPVLRQELLGRSDSKSVPANHDPRERALHQARNRLNAARMGLALMRQQLSLGRDQDCAATLAKIESEFHTLCEQLDGLNHPDAPRSALPPRRTRRALLVEDDSNERELLAGFLRLAGMEVETAGDGCDALDRLRSPQKPDVVLLDMVLPRCDGPSTIEAIRRDPATSNLPIFAVSGYGPENFGNDPSRLRVDRWFRKPLDPQVLLRDLRQVGLDTAER